MLLGVLNLLMHGNQGHLCAQHIETLSPPPSHFVFLGKAALCSFRPAVTRSRSQLFPGLEGLGKKGGQTCSKERGGRRGSPGRR